MALVHMRDILYHAYHNNYAVGAFDLVSLDFLEAVIDAAERSRASVILSIENLISPIMMLNSCCLL